VSFANDEAGGRRRFSMPLSPEAAAEEIKSLRHCLNDLVIVLAMPAMWTGGDASQVIDTLLDALLSIVHLDFVYARVRHSAGARPYEILRLPHAQASTLQHREIGGLLNRWLEEEPNTWPSVVRKPLGDGEMSFVPLRLSLYEDAGLIIAGSQRTDFPRQTETLLLSVAVNQAILALKEARLLSAQKQAAAELDRCVAQRTSELANTVEELHLQVSMLQHIPVAAWTIKPDGTPDIVNQSWFDYTGQTAEYVKSNPEAWMTALHPDDREFASRSYWGGIRSRRSFAMEARFLRAADKTYRWHLNRAVALTDADGNLVKFVGTSTDIEDLKQAQEELRRTQAHLAHMTRVTTMGALTASIAHEIHQPLTGIITNANTCLLMLAADPPNVDGAGATARRIIRDGNRATSVIARLRALFSKKEAAIEAVDLNEAAREVLSLCLDDFQRNGVLVRSELSHELPLVAGDRVQLQQVILNLLSNALDAMRAVEDRPRELLIQTELREADSVCVIVRDTGVGFNPRDADKLFTAFYSTKNSGMGIGLSVSRSIIDSHHGRLWAAANDGPGATFAFSLPRATQEPIRVSAQSAARGSILGDPH